VSLGQTLICRPWWFKNATSIMISYVIWCNFISNDNAPYEKIINTLTSNKTTILLIWWENCILFILVWRWCYCRYVSDLLRRWCEAFVDMLLLALPSIFIDSSWRYFMFGWFLILRLVLKYHMKIKKSMHFYEFGWLFNCLSCKYDKCSC
jgi:hypothetical protein